MRKRDKPNVVTLSEEEFDQLIKQVKSCSLDEKTKDLIIGVLRSFLWISLRYQNQKTSISKLLAKIFGPKTEKNSGPKEGTKEKRRKSGNSDDDMGSGHGAGQSDKTEEKGKGHGKKGADEYPGAERIQVFHEHLKAGDLCPECNEGHLYRFEPSTILKIIGTPPIGARIYELEKLRCALCQQVFTAPLPQEAGEDRYHPTAKAMIALLNYGYGMPFYRLEQLQRSMQVPVPDATQADQAEELANCAKPIVDHLEKIAAQASSFGHDDTPMPVLSLIKENKTQDPPRRGMQTTAILAQAQGHKIALFKTGREHAGENLGHLLDKRDFGLPRPLQIADALAANFSHQYIDLVEKVLCMDHGRREFFDLLEQFPVESQHVVSELAKIYKNDADAKKLKLADGQRLEYHQTHSRQIMNNLNAWMEEKIENKEVEPNSPLGKAISYFTAHWNGLTQFLRAPGAPLSNAEVERLLKRCIRRRRNSQKYKTQAGAWIGDIIMSLIETARYADQNQFEYLVAIQTHKKQVRQNPALWLPWNFKQTLAATLS